MIILHSFKLVLLKKKNGQYLKQNYEITLFYDRYSLSRRLSNDFFFSIVCNGESGVCLQAIIKQFDYMKKYNTNNGRSLRNFYFQHYDNSAQSAKLSQNSGKS